MEKLKKRWGLKSNWQIIVVLFVFSITGSSSAYLSRPLLDFFELSRDQFGPSFLFGGLVYYILRIVLIFPIYQVLLVGFGWLFGQFTFFWNFEKKMLKRMGFAKILSWPTQKT